MGLSELASKPWVRATVTALVGLSLFSLGVVYLSLGRQPEVVSFMVVGGQSVRAGDRGVIRVSARLAEARRVTPVVISDVQIDGRPVGEGVDGDRPATVRFRVPEGVPGEVQLTLRASVGTPGSDGARQETLSMRLPVMRGSGDVLGVGSGHDALEPVHTAHRVDVVPEAGALSANMTNRVFVRVRDLAGVPVRGADVSVTHSALPEGAARCKTDGSGLCMLELVARQPTFRLNVTVVETKPDGTELRTDTAALLRSFGRHMLLRMAPSVVAPGHPINATLLTWEDAAEVFCDLYADDAWIWGERVRTKGGRATLSIDGLGEGWHHLQCYDHPLEPGEAFATLPVIVAAGDSLEVLLERVRTQSLEVPASIVAPDGTDRALAQAWWQSVLRDPPRSPSVLLATRAGDMATRKAERTATKTRLLSAMGLVFLMVLLWLADVILKHIIDTRDRMRAYTLEVLDDGDGQALAAQDQPLLVATFQERESLVRARGVLLATVLVGTIVANVVGFIWLLAIIR